MTQAKRTAVHLRWTMLRMAEGELPAAGERLGGNDAVPLQLACRTVAKAAAKLAMDPESNEAELQVRERATAGLRIYCTLVFMNSSKGITGFLCIWHVPGGGPG